MGANEQAEAGVGPRGTTSLRLPGGTLEQGVDRRLRFRALGTQHNRLDRELIARARALDPALFVVPEAIETDTEEIVVRYAMERAGSVSLASAIHAWRRDVAISLPLILDLAGFLVEATERLEAAGLQALISSPGLIRYTPGARGPWRVLALPATRPALSDWMLADRDAWLWVPPEVMLRGSSVCLSYLVGAVIHQGLVGDPFPDLLPARERITRLLSGRVGSTELVEKAIMEAIPSSLSAERSALVAWVSEGLAPEATARPPLPELRRRLEEARGSLSVLRLAAHWESEGAGRLALEILSFHAESAAPNQVPWDTIARLKEAVGDSEGATQATLRLLELGGTVGREHHRLLRVAGRGSEAQRASLRKAIAANDQYSYQSPDDPQRPYLAHLEARYLNEPEAALARLSSEPSGSWAKAVRAAIISRVHCDNGDYARVSRVTTDAIAVTNSMPAGGGTTGTYLHAYFRVLGGIANFGAIGKFQRMDFATDSFKALIDGLNLARQIEAEDLVDAALHWLGWLARFAESFPSPGFNSIRVGVQAYLKAVGLFDKAQSDSFTRAPVTPWYDENIIFPADSEDYPRGVQ